MPKTVAAFTLVLMFWVAGPAQQNSRSGAVRLQAANAPAHAVQVSGRLSNDGRELVSDDEDRWAVSNPKALQGHEGQWITVKCQLSSDQSTIHVIAIKSSATSYASRGSDAAFRR